MSKELVGQKHNCWALYHGSIELNDLKNHKPIAVFTHFDIAHRFAAARWVDFTIASMYNDLFK